MSFSGIESLDELIKVAKSDVTITDEMVQHFVERTKQHIDLVKKYCKKIYDYDPERFEGIIEQGEEHDESKWHAPEIEPYVLISWQYHCKNNGKDCPYPDEVKDALNDATEHHIKHNKHHPESHDEEAGDRLINREDRDAVPAKLVDTSKMDIISIAEMCADWCAVSEEVGETPHDWADKNVGRRWDFSDDKVALIYEILDNVWGKRDED